MVGPTTEGKDERENDDTDDDNDLDGGQPELEFPKETNAKVVDTNDADEEDGDPNTRIDAITRQPILDDQGSGGQLIGRDDDVFEPVSVTVRYVSRGRWWATYVQPRAKPREGSQKRAA